MSGTIHPEEPARSVVHGASLTLTLTLTLTLSLSLSLSLN